ncbi:hypothetical protein VC83_00659 [Pseudogymnoascus destructans]|uniref:Uncharacterized protein n=2 Tax=Pseudogymnoascus destructans TaxID=655981 RepID=L8FSM7_PSED2|nr:uncharacterized protein VC83_00659 [Pseudogymnoascus destructans]ELR03975.1 hypothetical protein GMDG_06497 [Pseudogymnoascus destructans 20631-21]OAF63157.1 hypothetical protein VC83_00659 [Pseudogymnoascus destructans]
MEGADTEDGATNRGPRNSLVPNNIADSLLRDVLQRRKHYEANCRHVAGRRDDVYKEIPINHLVPLAFHTTPSLLENFQDIDGVVQAVSEQYSSDKYKSDLFGDWQKYCKALNSQQRAVATFEGAIFFAAESISKPKEREAWISSSLDHLRLLKQLSSVSGDDKNGQKRKRGAGQDGRPSALDGHNPATRARSIEKTEVLAGVNLQAGSVPSLDSSFSEAIIAPMSDQSSAAAENGYQAEASKTNIAMMAEVDKLRSILGDYLVDGMNASRMRHHEKDIRWITFTNTVRLHVADDKGEDFKLEIWLCLSVGKAISQAKKNFTPSELGRSPLADNAENRLEDVIKPVEDLRSILGAYLFEAMKASNWRKEEETAGMSIGTSAVDVSFPDGDDGTDCKVVVMLGFGAGVDMFAKIYPRL